jgi:outer membrane receptor protein involved in Fe transport
VKNIEFSAGRQLSENIFTDVVAYNAKYSDVVGTAQVGDKTQNQAIGALHIWGIQARNQISVGDYTFYGNYTYTKAVNTKSEEGSEDVRIGDIPKHSFNLGGNALLYDKVNVNLRLNFVGDRETGENTTVDTNPYDKIEGYTILNGALTYEEIYAGFSLQLVANNIFDADYFHPGVRSADGFLYASRVPQQGRNFVLKLITEF